MTILVEKPLPPSMAIERPVTMETERAIEAGGIGDEG